jgi:hypothetical protein
MTVMFGRNLMPRAYVFQSNLGRLGCGMQGFVKEAIRHFEAW